MESVGDIKLCRRVGSKFLPYLLGREEWITYMNYIAHQATVDLAGQLPFEVGVRLTYQRGTRITHI